MVPYLSASVAFHASASCLSALVEAVQAASAVAASAAWAASVVQVALQASYQFAVVQAASAVQKFAFVHG